MAGHDRIRVLQMIPAHPRKIGIPQILEKLLDEGVELHERTLRRYLVDLAAIYPLQCDERSKPHQWCWAKGATPVLPPALDPQMALAFKLLEQQAHAILPPVTLGHLKQYFEHATQALAGASSEALRRWPEKIRILTTGFALQAPSVEMEVYSVVYRAVFDERQFEARYQNAKTREVKTHVVHPLALVVRGELRYLVCNLGERTQPNQLALWRIQAASLRAEPRRAPSGFDVDAFIRDGELLSPEMIDLRFRVRKEAGGFLHDLQLAPDQRLVADDDEWLVVDARVPDTRELRSWLHGFADHLEVLDPPLLREEFGRRARETAVRYNMPPIPRAARSWRRVSTFETEA